MRAAGGDRTPARQCQEKPALAEVFAPLSRLRGPHSRILGPVAAFPPRSRHLPAELLNCGSFAPSFS